MAKANRAPENRRVYGVRYPDGAVQPVSSGPVAIAHAAAANEHAARRAKERPDLPAPRTVVPVTCEQTPWVELDPTPSANGRMASC